MDKQLKKKILEFIPFEIKRPTSPISVILAIIVLGFFSKIGESLLDLLLGVVNPYTPEVLRIFSLVVTYPIPIKINILTLLIFAVLFFPIYRFFDKALLQKLGKTTIFEDEFDFGNKGWALNYWGSNNPDKTCRIENSSIVFQAEEADLVDTRKEYGAYFDLKNGIYEGSKYEVSCWVKSEQGTTMGFKLWVHDTMGHNDGKFPANFYMPGVDFEEVKLGFTGTSSQGLRIHLHNKAGSGKILVDKVRVIKVK